MNDSLKVLIVGAKIAGKSAFTVMFAQGVFINKHDPTVSESYIKHIDFEGEDIVLELVDSNATDQASYGELFYQKADVGVILYSITDERTLDEARRLYHEILDARAKHSLPQMPLALFGNKTDLAEKRQISTAHGAELAASLNCSFFEGSVQSNLNVSETIEHLVRMKRENDSNSKGTKRQNKNFNNKRKNICVAM